MTSAPKKKKKAASTRKRASRPSADEEVPHPPDAKHCVLCGSENPMPVRLAPKRRVVMTAHYIVEEGDNGRNRLVPHLQVEDQDTEDMIHEEFSFLPSDERVVEDEAHAQAYALVLAARFLMFRPMKAAVVTNNAILAEFARGDKSPDDLKLMEWISFVRDVFEPLQVSVQWVREDLAAVEGEGEDEGSATGTT